MPTIRRRWKQPYPRSITAGLNSTNFPDSSSSSAHRERGGKESWLLCHDLWNRKAVTIPREERRRKVSERHRTWRLEDHLCKACGGRILRCVTGGGMTGGGNPIYKCGDCGIATSAMGPEALCWCGFSHRRNSANPYTCLPFSVLREYPQLKKAFRSCGCDPERGEVGIVLTRDFAALCDGGEVDGE